MIQPKIVLIKDADPEITKYLENFITLLGPYKIQHASKDLEFWAMINAFEPVLIIFGKRDEELFLKEIQRKFPKIRVLILTKTPIGEKLFKNNPHIDVLNYPFDLKELSQKVKNFLPAPAETESKTDFTRLLVADDEPGINQLIMSLFEPLGIEVYAASDGEEALKIFKKNRCNLALLDLRMPKLAGPELIKFLETSIDPPPPKAILVMCAALGDNLNKIREMGYPIISKPMDPETLEEQILDARKKYGLALHSEKISFL